MNQLIDTEILMVCDIDHTLLEWGLSDDLVTRYVTFDDPYTNEVKEVPVNEGNVRVLTNWLARGATVIVWSRSGMKWANAALIALDIEHKNIIVAPKPIGYIDDKPCEEWMGEQVYLSPNNPWGKGSVV